MKKFAKMSLVAAVAVAGLTNVSASSLEEAVKNTDISGKVYVEFIADDNGVVGGSTATTTDLDFDITFSSKVNDNITSIVRLQADAAPAEGAVSTNQNADIDNIYFNYAKNNLSVDFGRWEMATPLTDGNQAEGVRASYKMDMVTLGGGYAISNETTNGDLGFVSAMATVGPVNLEAWYVAFSTDTQATAVDAGKTTTLVASTTFENVNLSARYADTDFNTVGTENGSTLKLTASTTISNVGVHATYLTTDEAGSSYNEDASAANGYELSQLDLAELSANAADSTLWAVGATLPVNTVTYALDYATLSEDITNTEATEIRLRGTHKMSPNFTIMATYSMYEEEDSAGATTVENDSSRIDFKYTF